jgi:hypothetical protein
VEGRVSASAQVGGWGAGPSHRPAAPAELGTEGRKTWQKLTGKYEFSADELVLLAEFCAQVDLLARLRAELAESDLQVASKVHGRILSPLVTGIHQAQAELRRLHQALAFPDPGSAVPDARPAAVTAGATGVSPVGRGQAGRLPRWVRDPRVMDWLTPTDVAASVERAAERHLEWERCGGTRGVGPQGPADAQLEGRQFAHLEAYGMFVTALDITYGRDRWPSSWASARMPWDAAPGGPPDGLVAAVRGLNARKPGH